MDTIQDLINQIKAILPNALVVETNDEVIIQTGLVSDLGGILLPAFVGEGEGEGDRRRGRGRQGEREK